MDRDDERRRDAGEQQVSRVVAVPVHGRAAPPHREHPVDDLGELPLRAVAQGREIRDQPHVPEEERHRRVGRDREDVPDERAPPLRPERHRVGIGEEPVGEPGPPEMEHRIHARLRHGEKGHCLGEAVDRGPPLLPQQEQDRRDERAGVADSDPPDEVDDRESPSDRRVDSPDPDPAHEEHADGEKEEDRQQESDAEPDRPEDRSLARQNDGRDLVRDGAECVSRPDHTAVFGRARREEVRCLHEVFLSTSQLPATAGLGLRTAAR